MLRRIVVGSSAGKLETVLGKLATLHSKNNFAFAILTGNVFGEEDDETVAGLLNGTITVPLPTYFTVGTTPLPPSIVAKIKNDEEICDNLHYLGKRSITKTSDGFRIVTLGGSLDDKIIGGGQSKEQYLPLHTAEDAKILRGANSADILLTSVWPKNVWQGSQMAIGAKPYEIPSTEGIAELCAALKPRYHFTASAGDYFYEREPFFHPPTGGGGGVGEAKDTYYITRFISLAPFGNDAKAKAMYAFNLRPGPDTTVSIPQGSTPSPFYNAAEARGKRRRDGDDEARAADGGGYSRFSTAGSGDRRNRKHQRTQDRRRSSPPGPDKCFFCLSNPTLPVNMVCAVGDESYVATAKGPLPDPSWSTSRNGKDKKREAGEDDDGRGSLGFPGHMLVVPLPHAPTLAAMAVDAERTFAEMARFRDAVQAMVTRRSNHRLGVVTWEISLARGVHLHWQMVPVPAAMVRKGLVDAAFRVEAENCGYPKLEELELGPVDAADIGDYFRAWTFADDGEGKAVGKSLVMRLDSPGARFDVQFGRRVIAKLLGVEKTRGDWHDCVQTEEEETEDAEKFKAAFKEWDFTLQ